MKTAAHEKQRILNRFQIKCTDGRWPLSSLHVNFFTWVNFLIFTRFIWRLCSDHNKALNQIVIKRVIHVSISELYSNRHMFTSSSIICRIIWSIEKDCHSIACDDNFKLITLLRVVISNSNNRIISNHFWLSRLECDFSVVCC